MKNVFHKNKQIWHDTLKLWDDLICTYIKNCIKYENIKTGLILIQAQ